MTSMARPQRAIRYSLVLALLAVAVAFAAHATVAVAAQTPGAGWTLDSAAEPSIFNATDSEDSVEELVVRATGGTYELEPSLFPVSTGPIKWDATAPELQAALEGLAAVGKGNVLVTGGPGDATGSHPYIITWVGALSGNSPGGLGVVETKLTNEAGEAGTTRNRIQQETVRDRILVIVTNTGSRPTSGEIVLKDQLPEGLVPVRLELDESTENTSGECSLEQRQCTYSEPLAPGAQLRFLVYVAVPAGTPAGKLVNEASVKGGGGSETVASQELAIQEGTPEFGIESFTFNAFGVGGRIDSQAGDHPYSVTTHLALTDKLSPASIASERPYETVQEARRIIVELPLGFVGNPLAVDRCPEIDLATQIGPAGHQHAICPERTEVGTVQLVWNGGSSSGLFPVYNVEPERGYPAELGFNAVGSPVVLYASVVPSPAGYRLQVSSPGAIRSQSIEQISVTIFGTPGEKNRSGSNTAFLTNPTACSSAPLSARLDLTAWEGGAETAEATAYPPLEGCNLFQGVSSFAPRLELTPEVQTADKPSGLEATLTVPQAPDVAGVLATPTLENASVTLPAGFAISPTAASGPSALEACSPQSIGLLATELGEGHPGGNGSPYDDGLEHAMPGNCPEASRIGTVEIQTPLLTKPLLGHIYVAQPTCGGTGQTECTEALAEEGGVFSLYVEAAGSGVIVKLAVTVEVGGHGAHSRLTGLAPGQIRTTFKETPQFPFEAVKLVFAGRERAPLATPQSCGAATTTSDLTPWSSPGTPDAAPSWTNDFGGCAPSMLLAAGFSAGVVDPHSDTSTTFTTSIARQDGEQNIGGVTIHMPEGVLGSVVGVEQCGEAQANAGTCSEGSRLGSVAVATGSGSQPLWLPGSAYLTGPYRGAPFGLAIVVPAKAGPFNLGNEVVRATIGVDPRTSAITVVSNPLPLERDGVPFRLKQINVTVDRPGFITTPTDCAESAVAGALTGLLPNGAPGSTEPVSTRFAVAGCRDLPFAPGFRVSTSGKTSKADGASLKVDLTYPHGGEANIHSVHVELPKSLPARLTTLQKACTEQEFDTNPATCPAASVVGHAKAITPILPVPLEGPAYFVSHGGAAFPELVMVLQGDGVVIQLNGKTFISKAGITSSTFASVPDAPVSSFELTLPEEPNSVLAANGDLCDQKLIIPTLIGGQNGAQVKQSTRIEVEGCDKTLSVVSAKVKKKTLKLTVYAPAAGRVTVSGKGVSSGSKSYLGVEAQTFTLAQKKAGKLKTTVKVAFTPSAGRDRKKQFKTVKVTFKK